MQPHTEKTPLDDSLQQRFREVLETIQVIPQQVRGRVVVELADKIMLRVGTRDRTIQRSKIESMTTVARLCRPNWSRRSTRWY